MTAKNSSQADWEEEELANPLGRIKWTLNALTNEITVRDSFKTTDQEFPPWDGLQDDIVSAVVSDGVTAIEDYTFGWFWSLESVQIPNSVTSIGREAFTYCTSLKFIAIPDSVESLNLRPSTNASFPHSSSPNQSPPSVEIHSPGATICGRSMPLRIQTSFTLTMS